MSAHHYISEATNAYVLLHFFDIHESALPHLVSTEVSVVLGTALKGVPLGGIIGYGKARPSVTSASLKPKLNAHTVLTLSCCSVLAPISFSAMIGYLVQCVTRDVSVAEVLVPPRRSHIAGLRLRRSR